MATIIYILIIIVGVIIFNLATSYYNRKKSKKARNNDSTPDIDNPHSELPKNVMPAAREHSYETLMKFLKKNGCQIESTEDKDDNDFLVSFVFNGGHYDALVSKSKDELLLYYNNFYETKSEDIDRITALANNINQKIKYYKIVCSYDSEKNSLQLHLAYETFSINQEELSFILSMFPHVTMEIMKDLKESETSINQERLNDYRREYIMLKAAEYTHNKTPLIANQLHPLSVGSVIENIYGDDTDLEHLTAYKQGNIETQNGKETIIDFDIVSLIFNKITGQLFNDALAEIESKNYKYLLNLDTISQNKFSIYFRLTISRIPKTDSNKIDATITPATYSFVAAYDKTTEKNQHNEFKYMQLDAQYKIQNGQEDELTDEQRFIAKLDNYIGKQAYYSFKLFYNKQFYQSIEIAKPLFNDLKNNFFTLNDVNEQLFYEIAYIIGFSYCELNIYDTAFYYIDIARNAGKENYFMEYINCVVNATDVRVFRDIDQMIELVRDRINKNTDESRAEQYMQFYEFLMRRRGYALINFKQLDEAEKLFSDMLQSQFSKDYAQNELDYIKHIREQQKTAENENKENNKQQ